MFFTLPKLFDFDAVDLRDADLSGADLSVAHLRDADLRGADLSGAHLRDADLRGADLRDADLSGAHLRGADLSGADLRGAGLSGANLRDADLSGADLRGAGLSGANLRDADLSGADLSGADLSGASLVDADLSGAVGLPRSPNVFLEHTADGVIAYKAFGNTTRAPRPEWVIKPGSVISEAGCNPDRFANCGSGVNVASTLQWVRNNYPEAESYWRVLVRWQDLPNVVVPYGSDGKYRCTRITLLEKLEV